VRAARPWSLHGRRRRRSRAGRRHRCCAHGRSGRGRLGRLGRGAMMTGAVMHDMVPDDPAMGPRISAMGDGRRDIGLFRRSCHRRRCSRRRCGRRRGRRHLSGLRTRARGEQSHDACDKNWPGHPFHYFSPMVMCRTLGGTSFTPGRALPGGNARPRRMRLLGRWPPRRRRTGGRRSGVCWRRLGHRRSGRRTIMGAMPDHVVMTHIPAVAPALGITPMHRCVIRYLGCRRHRRWGWLRGRHWRRRRWRRLSRLDWSACAESCHDASDENCLGNLPHNLSPFWWWASPNGRTCR
jgi:hypothetical protein